MAPATCTDVGAEDAAACPMTVDVKAVKMDAANAARNILVIFGRLCGECVWVNSQCLTASRKLKLSITSICVEHAQQSSV